MEKAFVEYELVHALDHANIARFLDFEFYPSKSDAKKLMLYMDLYEHNSLDELIARRKEKYTNVPVEG